MTHDNKLSSGWRRWRMAAIIGGGLAIAAAASNGPGVARLSLMQGKVSVLQAGSKSWQTAVLNTPLVEGDAVYLAGKGRAEVQFDRNDSVQMAGHSELILTHYRQQRLQLQMKLGTITVSRFQHAQLQTEIDTPNMSVRPQGTSEVRVDVVDASHTAVTVRHGSALVWTSQGKVSIKQGQQIQIAGIQNPQYRVVSAPASDSWDHWVSQRDEALLRSPSNRYLNANIYGGGNLNRYGNWVWVPNYGEVWHPAYEASGWSPYYNGRWVWIPDYGWTWVSYEQWGWAPYHYGRWFWAADDGWCWWPGPLYGDDFWAPAYVDFFYAGASWGFNFGFGGGPCIGWLPLAPFEPYYGYTQVNYITNVTNITNITNINGGSTGIVNGVKMVNGTPLYRRSGYYGARHPQPGGEKKVNGQPLISRSGIQHLKNYRAPGGVVAISSRGFASGRVSQLGKRLTRPGLTQVGLVRGTAPVAPTRASFHLLPGAGRAALPPAQLNRIKVFQHTPIRMTPHVVPISRIQNSINQARAHFTAIAGTYARPGSGRSHPAAARSGNRAATFSRTANHAGIHTGSARTVITRTSIGRGVLAGKSGVRSFAVNRPAISGRAPAAPSGWHSFGSPAGRTVTYPRSAGPRTAAPAANPHAISPRTSRGQSSRTFPTLRQSSGRGYTARGNTNGRIFMNHPNVSGMNRSSVAGQGRSNAQPWGGRVSRTGPNPSYGGTRASNGTGWGRRVSSPGSNTGGYSRSGGYGRPASGGYRPTGRASGGYRPSSGGYRPSSGGYHAPSGGYRPSSGGYHAPSGGYHAPAYHAPAYHAPSYHAPAYHAPAYHAPAYHSAGPPHRH